MYTVSVKEYKLFQVTYYDFNNSIYFASYQAINYINMH